MDIDIAHSQTSTNGHLSTTATSLQRPGFFVPCNSAPIHRLYSNWNLPTAPGHLSQRSVNSEGGHCREVQLSLEMKWHTIVFGLKWTKLYKTACRPNFFPVSLSYLAGRSTSEKGKCTNLKICIIPRDQLLEKAGDKCLIQRTCVHCWAHQMSRNHSRCSLYSGDPSHLSRARRNWCVQRYILKPKTKHNNIVSWWIFFSLEK